ncbi:IclR family transcriptional regulator [Calidifontibacillus erzurumensis]|uniref:IclR family transcriptional regulator n=1 Tax=Calidifontibacillus erzurumensis TaxID=2741433 RepID=A0A8J8KAQ2_9BACI|nr:IclR family transcriptional regulator [Calidifontibacillus erzurumensis]NSL50318.1 IclR family transcriptional regulator [Calidifontibacillus erzurumensis]
MTSKSNSTQTLKRGLDILFVLGEAGTTLSVSEIAERVNIPESTAYRLLQTMEKVEVVERKDKGQIGLGMRILHLARSLSQQMDRQINEIARPFMEKLTKQVNETSVLTIRTGLEVICIESCESTRLIRFVVENGKLLPLYSGASGKAILAYESKQIIDQVLARLENESKKEALMKELTQIQSDGYSLTFSEVDRDVFGLAAPIFDKTGRIIASLTIAGPVERWEEHSQRDLIQAVIDSAKQITEHLKSKI